jgi:hypothetical protein
LHRELKFRKLADLKSKFNLADLKDQKYSSTHHLKKDSLIAPQKNTSAPEMPAPPQNPAPKTKAKSDHRYS